MKMLIGVVDDEFYLSRWIKCVYLLRSEVIGQRKTNSIVAGRQPIVGQIGNTSIGVGRARTNLFPLLLFQLQYDGDAWGGSADRRV